MIFCDVSSCEYWDDGTCAKDDVTISDSELIAAGFVPTCTDYVEAISEIEKG